MLSNVNKASTNSTRQLHRKTWTNNLVSLTCVVNFNPDSLKVRMQCWHEKKNWNTIQRLLSTKFYFYKIQMPYNIEFLQETNIINNSRLYDYCKLYLTQTKDSTKGRGAARQQKPPLLTARPARAVRPVVRRRLTTSLGSFLRGWQNMELTGSTGYKYIVRFWFCGASLSCLQVP